jgi:putative copper resistance protein D
MVALVRAAHFLALMTIFGAQTFGVLARRSKVVLTPLPARLFFACAGLALVTALAWFALSQPSGPAMIVRIALATLLVPLANRPLPAALFSGLALATIALASQAAASGPHAFFALRALNDAAHLMAAGFWVGGLVALAPTVFSRAPGELLASLRLFSRWAMGAVAVLIAAGSLNFYLILFAGEARWSRTYITLLAAKIVLASLMVALALSNRFELLPGLAKSEPEALSSLKISVASEIVLGAIVVGIATLLGLLSPASP